MVRLYRVICCIYSVIVTIIVAMGDEGGTARLFLLLVLFVRCYYHGIAWHLGKSASASTRHVRSSIPLGTEKEKERDDTLP